MGGRDGYRFGPFGNLVNECHMSSILAGSAAVLPLGMAGNAGTGSNNGAG